jgi:hypothetical protein
MSNNVITFPEPAGLFPKRRSRENVRNGSNMHTFLFRSYDLIMESDEADLIRDVCLDIHKAEVKLKKVRQRLQGIQGPKFGCSRRRTSS